MVESGRLLVAKNLKMKSKRRSCRALSRYQREVLPIVTTGNTPQVLLWLWCLPPPSPPASPLSPSARGDRPQAWATQVHSSAPLLSTAPLCEDLTALQRNPSSGELRLTSRGLGVPLGGCVVNTPSKTTPRRQGMLCRISPNFL